MVGRYSSVLEDIGRKATVTRFTSKIGEPMTVLVVTAAVAYDCKYTWKTFILVIYIELYFQNMETNLVPPIMMHLSGLDVDEFPKLLSSKPTEKKSLCVIPDVRHKATITDWRKDIVYTHPEAAEGWTQGIWRRIYFWLQIHQSETHIWPYIGTKNVCWWTSRGKSSRRVTLEARSITG